MSYPGGSSPAGPGGRRMNVRSWLKISVDLAMILCLLALMCFQSTGPAVHEVLGCAMFLLLLLHTALNLRWYAALARGGWTPLRVCQTLLDFAAASVLTAQALSGMHISGLLGLSRGMELARSIHLACGWWSFVLISLHAGMHLGFAGGLARRSLGTAHKHVFPAFRAAAAVLALCGAREFLRSNAIPCLTLKAGFAFFDFSKSTVSVAASNFSIMVFFMLAGSVCFRLLARISAK